MEIISPLNYSRADDYCGNVIARNIAIINDDNIIIGESITDISLQQ